MVVRAKAKMQNTLSRKSLEKNKQIQPCFSTDLTTNQLGTSPKTWSTPKTFRNHLKIARNTKNLRGTWKTEHQKTTEITQTYLKQSRNNRKLLRTLKTLNNTQSHNLVRPTSLKNLRTLLICHKCLQDFNNIHH